MSDLAERIKKAKEEKKGILDYKDNGEFSVILGFTSEFKTFLEKILKTSSMYYELNENMDDVVEAIRTEFPEEEEVIQEVYKTKHGYGLKINISKRYDVRTLQDAIYGRLSDGKLLAGEKYIVRSEQNLNKDPFYRGAIEGAQIKSVGIIEDAGETEGAATYEEALLNNGWIGYAMQVIGDGRREETFKTPNSGKKNSIRIYQAGEGLKDIKTVIIWRDAAEKIGVNLEFNGLDLDTARTIEGAYDIAKEVGYIQGRTSSCRVNSKPKK